MSDVSVFRLIDSPTNPVANVVLQVRTLGTELDYDSVELVLETPTGPRRLKPLFRVERDRGTVLGASVSSLWQWDLTGAETTGYFLEFQAAGSSLSLDAVTLDTAATFTLVDGAPAAEIIDLEINPALSQLLVSPAAFDGLEFVAASPQGDSSMTAAISGQVRLEVGANQVRVVSAQLQLENSGVWFPGPFQGPPGSREFNTNPAPAVYGYDYSAPFPLSVAVRGLMFGLESSVATIRTSLGFPVTNQAVRVTAGTADLTLGNPPQSDLTTYPVVNNGSTNAGSFVGGSVETLTIPLDWTYLIEGGLFLQTQYSGTLVAVRVPQPQLTITAASSSLLRLTWPLGSSGYQLQQSAGPLNAPVWSLVTNAPVLSGSSWQLELPVEAGSWFRLVK